MQFQVRDAAGAKDLRLTVERYARGCPDARWSAVVHPATGGGGYLGSLTSVDDRGTSGGILRLPASFAAGESARSRAAMPCTTTASMALFVDDTE